MEEKDIEKEEILNNSQEEANASDAKASDASNDNVSNNADKNDNCESNKTETSAENKEEAEEKDPLTVAQETIEALKKDMLYKQAEFDNYRKRTMKEKAELILQGGEKTIKEILPVLDDFERAVADTTNDPEAIKEGMNLIFRKFKSTLEKLGVKRIETEGADFDVDFHEAIALVPGMGEAMKGKIIDCTKTGYTLNNKVIRHAQVAVGQ